MTNCGSVREWLRLDLDGAAEPSSEVAAHLGRCDACAAEAGRNRAIAEAARAVLPAAEVPIDFTELVMDAVTGPAGDRGLAEAARSRLLRWVPLFVVAALLPALLLIPSAETMSGELRVERDGEWVEAASVPDGDPFALEPGSLAQRGDLTVTAMGPSLLRAAEGLELLGGSALLKADGALAATTVLGEIRMDAGTTCIATLEANSTTKGEEMSFSKLQTLVPTVLAVTVLAGNANVVNAQGAQPAAAGERVIVEGSNPPRLDVQAVQDQLDRLTTELAEARRRIAALQSKEMEAKQQRFHEAEEAYRRAMKLREGAVLAKQLADVESRLAEARTRYEEGHVKIRMLSEQLELHRARLDPDRIQQVNQEVVARLNFTTDALDSIDSYSALLERAKKGDAEARERLQRMAREIDEALARKVAAEKAGLVTLRFDNADIQQVIGILAAQSGVDIEISPEVSGRVTANLKDIPWRDALEQVVTTFGCTVVKDDRGVLCVVSGDGPAGQPDESLARRVALQNMINLLQSDLSQLHEIAKEQDTAEVNAQIEALTVELMRLHDELTRLAPDQPVRRAPNLAGKTIKVQGRIVVISVGRHDRVRIGDTFHLRRGATYVGSIRILRVEDDSALGEFDVAFPGPGGPPQVGDIAYVSD